MRHLRHLVYLVEDKHGIARAGLLYRLDDTSGHRSDIGTTVSADLCLVVQTTQRHTYVLTSHGLGNRLAQRGLTHARRTVETDDWALQIAPQCQHGHMFQDTLLHLLHAVVVLVQDLLRTLQVEVVFRIFIPGQVHQRLQIVQLHIEVGTLRIQIVQLVGFLIEEALHLHRPFLVAGLTY